MIRRTSIASDCVAAGVLAALVCLAPLLACSSSDKDSGSDQGKDQGKDQGEDQGKDKAAERAEAEQAEAKKKASEGGSSGFSLSGSAGKLKGWGRSVGETVGDGVDDAVDTARDEASAAAAAIKGGAIGLAERAKARAVAAKESVTTFMADTVMGTYVDATVVRFGQQLDRLADDPRRDRTTLETATKFAMRQIPVLKQMDKYADARALYAAYADGDDAHSRAMRRTAKRQVLLLSIQVGLDVTMFGLPSFLDMPFEYADQIIDKAELAAKASKMLGKVPWVSLSWADLSAKDLDVLSPVLDRALDDEIVNRSATTLLTHQFSE